MKKTLLVFMLALALVFAFAATAMAAAGDVGVTPTTLDGSTEIAENGTITVTFTGAVASAGWYKVVFSDVATNDAVEATDGSLSITASATSTAISGTGEKTVAWELHKSDTSGGAYSPVAGVEGTITVYVGDDDKEVTGLTGVTSVNINNTNNTISAKFTGTAAFTLGGSYNGDAIASDNFAGVSGTPSISGSSPFSVQLTPTASAITFDLTVTAENDTTREYAVTLFRDPVLTDLDLYDRSSSGNEYNGTFTFPTYDFDIDGNPDYVWFQPTWQADAPGIIRTATGLTTDGGRYKLALGSSTTGVTLNLGVEGYSATLGTQSVNFHRALLNSVAIYEENDDASKYELDDASMKVGDNEYSLDVDDDEDLDSVWLKINEWTYSEVASVYVNKNSGSSNEVKKSTKGDKLYEIDLKSSGTTTVYINVESKNGSAENTYEIEIRSDGSSSSSDMLIDSVEATSKDNGKGDDYLAFFDNGGGNIYIFRPYDNRSDDIWLKIDSDEDVYYNGSSSDKEGDWVEVEDGDTVEIDDEEFEITVYTGGKSDDDDATLDDLSVKAGTKSSNTSAVSLSPTFASGTKSYTANIGSSNTYAQISAKLNDSSAYMIIDGYGLYHTSSAKTWNFSSLSTKTNSFKYTIHVIAEDCEESETYTVTLSRSSSDTTLKSLNVGGYTLTPAFTSGTKSYTAAVPSSVSSLSVSAAAGSGCTVIITGSANGVSLGSTTGTSGSASGNFTLQEGINTFTIASSSGGTNISYYYVTVYRQPASPVIKVSNQSVTINGTAKTLSAYNINGNNFIKLRDIADLLSGTTKKFQVVFDDAQQRVDLTLGGTYTRRGDEGSTLPAYKKYQASTQTVYLDSVRIYPMAYNIDGSNYVMIRDLASVMNFGITYTAATKTININTANSYTPGQ